MLEKEKAEAHGSHHSGVHIKLKFNRTLYTYESP